jgi:hypothetical protein
MGMHVYKCRKSIADVRVLRKILLGLGSACAERAMVKQESDKQESVKQESRKQEAAYDHHRYRKLLAGAVDETRRLELIELLIEEKARDRLEAQRTSDRVAMTAQTVAKVLSASRRDNLAAG